MPKKNKTKKIDDISYNLVNYDGDAIIEVDNLFFKYTEKSDYVLQNVNFKIKKGEYVTIIGHNGSGKSTLSKILIGILKPDLGKVKIFDKELNNKNINRIRKHLGIVFQNPDNQFIGSTVADDIAFGLENRQIKTEKMQEIVYQAAKKVNMENFLEYEPLMLSGGQKQRVAIASALALSADILLFDESTSMLDAKGKEEIKEIMLNLKQKENKTIISITHDMEEILNADRVIVLSKGKVVKVGTYKEIVKDPAFLKNLKLNTPFVVNVINSLKNKGVDIKTTFDIDKLVDYICEKR